MQHPGSIHYVKKIIIILRVKLEFFSALYNDHVQRIFKSLPRGIKVKKEYDKLIFLDIIIIQKIHIVFVLVISHIAGDGRPRWKAMSADTLIFLESEELILHIEFQTDPKEDIPYRMLDYATRLYRRYPHKPIHQVVIYLRKNDSAKVRQNDYQQGKTYHQFEVIRLWEQPSETLLQTPGLFPFAILAQAEKPENLLGQIALKYARLKRDTSRHQK